jgi:uncharacterized protein YkwD
MLAGLALMLLLLSGCGGGSDAAGGQGGTAGTTATGTTTTTATTTVGTTTGTAGSAAATATGPTAGTPAGSTAAARSDGSAGPAGTGTGTGGAVAVPGAGSANAAPVFGTAGATVSTTGAGGSGSGAASGTTPAAGSSQPPLADCGLDEHVDEILRRINALRARGASCGARGSYAPAAAVAWNTRLHAAASGHAADMAQRNYFSHTGPAGQTLSERVAAVDYAYRLVAENIAAGQSSLDAVLAGWMASDGHCANLMHPQVREVGLACSAATGARYTSYWTLNLGAAP